MSEQTRESEGAAREVVEALANLLLLAGYKETLMLYQVSPLIWWRGDWTGGEGAGSACFLQVPTIEIGREEGIVQIGFSSCEFSAYLSQRLTLQQVQNEC